MLNEPFAVGNSVIHRIDPRFRVVAAIFYSVAVAVVYSFPALTAAFSVFLALVAAAGLEPRRVFRQLAVVNLFVLMFWIILPLTGGGSVFYRVGPLPIHKDGIILAAQITLKSNAILMALIAMVSTMDFATLGHALNRLRFPGKLVFLFLLTYRYIFVIEQEFNRIWRAMKIRGFVPATSIHCYKSYAYLLGILFIRASDRADRVYRAMQCRGFDGRFHTLSEFPPSSMNRCFSAFTGTAIIGIILLEYFYHA